MSIIYCNRGDHYVDTDYNTDVFYLEDEIVCWDHMTGEEQMDLERKEELKRDGGRKTIAILVLWSVIVMIVAILCKVY